MKNKIIIGLIILTTVFFSIGALLPGVYSNADTKLDFYQMAFISGFCAIFTKLLVKDKEDTK